MSTLDVPATPEPFTYADHADVDEEAGAELHDHDVEPAGAENGAHTTIRALFAGTTSTAARAASWADYEWATWWPEILRAAGVPVIVEPGFATNGRPRSVGRFTPRGVMWHHDASPAGPTPGEAEFIGKRGRPAEGIPAPLAGAWVCAGCNDAHAVGTWHLLAAGRANHAGTGAGFGGIGRDAGNVAALGVETDHTSGEAWPPALLRSLHVGTAATLRHLRSDPARWLCGHREYTDRKVDPDALDLGAARRTVAGMIERRETFAGRPPAHPPTPRPRPGASHGPVPTWAPAPFPGRGYFRLGHAHAVVLRLENWLHDVGLLHGPRTELFTARTRAAVRTFQERRPRLAGDADGYPGPLTWELLQRAAHAARSGHPAHP